MFSFDEFTTAETLRDTIDFLTGTDLETIIDHIEIWEDVVVTEAEIDEMVKDFESMLEVREDYEYWEKCERGTVYGT